MSGFESPADFRKRFCQRRSGKDGKGSCESFLRLRVVIPYGRCEYAIDSEEETRPAKRLCDS